MADLLSSRYPIDVGIPLGYALAQRRRRHAVGEADPVRIPQAVKDCVVYLYDHGKPVGTGFLVGVPTAPASKRSFCYVVTARHVVRDRAAISVRINSLSGDAVHVDAVPDTWWETNDSRVDVAAALLLVDEELISPTMVGMHQIASLDFL